MLCWIAFGFSCTKTLKLVHKSSDELAHILLLEVKLEDAVFVVINIYNANTKNTDFRKLAGYPKKSTISRENFNIIFI